MTTQDPLFHTGKSLTQALAELLRGDTWTVHHLSPTRLRIDHVRGVNLQPVCIIDVDQAARRIEVSSPFPTKIPANKSAAVSAYMSALSDRIHPMLWKLDHDRLDLMYFIEMELPATLSEKILLESATRRRVRMWAQGCINRLDRYAFGVNSILAGTPLQGVMAEMMRAETEDAIFEANWLLGEGERV